MARIRVTKIGDENQDEENEAIGMYDSWNINESQHIIKQITSFLHCQAPYFTLRVISSQLQQGDCDCAHIAIATATSLCHGESPNSIPWDQMLMRSHHSKSFELYRKDDAIS